MFTETDRRMLQDGISSYHLGMSSNCQQCGHTFDTDGMWTCYGGMQDTLLHNTYIYPFNGPLDPVQDHPGESVPEPIWILLKQETVSGSGISWDICKSAPRPRHITMPAPHHSVFHRPDALPAAQPTASKHWRQLQDTLFWSENSVMVNILNNLSSLSDLQFYCACFKWQETVEV